MNAASKIARDYTKRQLASARAQKGWSWTDISALLDELGIDQTSNNLTTKHSRGAFKAADFLLMLRAMGVLYLDLSQLEIPGLDKAIQEMEKKRKAAAE